MNDVLMLKKLNKVSKPFVQGNFIFYPPIFETLLSSVIKVVFILKICKLGDRYDDDCKEDRQNDCTHNQEAAALILAQVLFHLVTALDARFVDACSGAVLRSVVNDFFVLVVVTVAFAATAGRTAKICPIALVVPELLAVVDVALLFRVTRVGWHYHVGVRQCTGSRSLANHSRVCKHRLHRL